MIHVRSYALLGAKKIGEDVHVDIKEIFLTYTYNPDGTLNVSQK